MEEAATGSGAMPSEIGSLTSPAIVADGEMRHTVLPQRAASAGTAPFFVPAWGNSATLRSSSAGETHRVVLAARGREIL